MRPLYESEGDRTVEREAIEKIASAWGLSFAKMKISNVLDFALLNGKKVVAVAEVKGRNYSSVDIDRFGGLILSAGKILAARGWVNLLRVPFVLVVKLTDGLFYMVFEPDADWPQLSVEMAGRKDRNDWQDIEPCCLIPMNLFTRI
jgi:hypothetical protein